MVNIIFLLLLTVSTAQGQPQPAPSANPADKVPFRPSVAMEIVMFSMVLSLAFLLIMYTKFCHASSPPLLPTTAGAAASHDEASGGVDKAVIYSLPFFRFAALRGARQGLECAVCLDRFDDADLLRLLPRCRHAFHRDCIDRWLSSSANCPLCRAQVCADDVDLGIQYAAASARFIFGATGEDVPTADTDAAAGAPSSGSSGRDLMAGIFVERVPSSRFGAGVRASDDDRLDRHRHRIIISDALFKSRWSDLNSSDLIALDTEMLRSFTSDRFDYYTDDIIADDEEKRHPPMKQEDGGGRLLEKKRLLESSSIAVDEASSSSASTRGRSSVRSISEIVRLPKVARPKARTEEERRWKPIARRTVRWFAKREDTGVLFESVSTAGNGHIHLQDEKYSRSGEL